jgi:hypothetical protein
MISAGTGGEILASLVWRSGAALLPPFPSIIVFPADWSRRLAWLRHHGDTYGGRITSAGRRSTSPLRLRVQKALRSPMKPP